MFLVLIETSGNQNYIFSTNKLKENVGASELTYLAGTKWVMDAVADVNSDNGNSKTSLWNKSGSRALRQNLLDPQLNRPIETHEDVHVEVIIATSGKSLLLAKDREHAKEVIQKVTHKALVAAPGLDIHGVIQEFNWEQDKLKCVNRKIHQKFEEIRSKKPSPALRFLRLPVVAECSNSGLPASYWEIDKEGKLILKSVVSDRKMRCNKRALRRFQSFLDEEKIDIDFLASIRALNEEFDEQLKPRSNNIASQEFKREWLAVVHADGNGLGEIFLDFGKNLNTREYIQEYRKFSIALDVCTEQAFLEALKALPSLPKSDKNQGKIIPLVPLVVGGDDLTAVCNGRYALQFTKVFLQEFEKNTEYLNNLDNNLKQLQGIIPKIAKESSLNTPRLSACAGIAIIKPHFPFSVAYELAESLLRSAKKVKDRIKKESKIIN